MSEATNLGKSTLLTPSVNAPTRAGALAVDQIGADRDHVLGDPPARLLRQRVVRWRAQQHVPHRRPDVAEGLGVDLAPMRPGDPRLLCEHGRHGPSYR